MELLKKIIQKIKTIWQNKAKIFEGLKNALIHRPEVETVAFNRMQECLKCDQIDHEGTKCLVPGTAPCCGVCGCKLYLKTRSLSSSCEHPNGSKWKAQMTAEEEDVYYQKINFKVDNE